MNISVELEKIFSTEFKQFPKNAGKEKDCTLWCRFIRRNGL